MIDVPAGARWGGTPAKPIAKWFREDDDDRNDSRAARRRRNGRRTSESDAMDKAATTIEMQPTSRRC